jgi:hypothetical protein
MNKKIIMSIAIVLLLSLAVFVSATMTVKEEYTSGNKYDVEIHVEKGWNIVSGLYDVREIKESSEVQKSDVKAIWYYSPLKSKYLNMHPNMNDDEFAEDISYFMGDDPVMTSAMWLYSEKSGTLEYSTIRYDKLDKRKLASGWNFVSLTPEMSNDFTGSCNIEKSYFWDIGNNKWLTFPVSNPTEFTWDGDNVFGYGLIIKVTEGCILGSSNEGGTTPPILPN